MLRDTLRHFQDTSVAKRFKKDEYIFYEGQPGNEMYIVLKGSVGVYVSDDLGAIRQVSVVKEGGFFGEMAIFDNMPRSASCIAMEDTVCVTIEKKNLRDFFSSCPDIAAKMVENMSIRIRKLSEEIYSTKRTVVSKNVEEFFIPEEFQKGCELHSFSQNIEYYDNIDEKCPICESNISMVNIRKNNIKVQRIFMDGRVQYVNCEPMWYEVQTCPYCNYSNHYLKFFDINKTDFKEVDSLLMKEQLPVIKMFGRNKTEYDKLVIRYLQAINVNEHINPGDDILVGKLWTKLYWLSKDVNNKEFEKYCANKAIERYVRVVENNVIKDGSKMSYIVLVLANLYRCVGNDIEAKRYCDMALASPMFIIKQNAEELSKML